MKEVVWVFGTSASGKETFMKNVPGDKALLEKLGWLHRTVVNCPESLEHIGQSENDPATSLREKILEEVPILLNTAEVVLIKWQYVDSVASRPQRLKDLLPGVRHRVIELKVGIDEVVRRLPNKSWWDRPGREKAFIETELGLVSKSLSELSNDFEITSINSSASGNYEFIRISKESL